MTERTPADRVEAARAALLREAGIAEEAQATALEQLTRVAVAATGAAAAFVSLLGERETYFRCSTGLAPPFGGEPSNSVVRHILATTGPQALADVRDDPALREAWEVSLLGAVALLAVPLVVDGVPLGALAVLDQAPRPWSPREQRALTDVAQVATRQIALSRAARTAAAREAERAERALVASETRFRSLVEHVPDGIFLLRELHVAYANPAAVTLAGATDVEALVGRSAEALFVPPFLKTIRQDILRGEPGPAKRAEEQLTRLDGERREVEVAALPYLSDEAPAILLLVRDVTEKLQAEAAIRRQEAQLRLLAEQLPVLVWATDAALRVTSAAGRGGLAPSPDRIGEPLRELLGSRDPGGVPLASQRSAAAGETARYRVDWRDRTFDVHVEPLREDGGAIVGTVGVAMDVTDQTRLAEQVREARTLATLGEMAAGVAHEMNNILGTVAGLAAALALAPDTSPRAREDLAILQRAAGRGGEITSRLLGFARKGMYRRARVDVAAILERVAEASRARSPAVSVECSVAPGLPPVEGDHEQLEAALVSLSENALDAMPGGGTLHLDARTEDRPAQRPDLPAERWVRVEVTDTGVGMSEEVRARAIDPFFTTKAVGQGAGLGLSMAYGVVRNHGGDLTLTSEPGRGTHVLVRLPAAEGAIAAPPAPRAAPPAAAPGLVLVVDDDEWIRWSAGRLLEAIGYEVVEAAGGQEALDTYAARGPEFVAVLLDLRMPGLDGAEVLRRLVLQDPDARVILCTGYERDQVSQGLFGLGHVGFLGKPFTLAELQEQLRLLARAPREHAIVD